MQNLMSSDLRKLPSVDKLLQSEQLSGLLDRHGHTLVRDAARAVLDDLRVRLQAGDEVSCPPDSQESQAYICQQVTSLVESGQAPTLLPVFNLSGIVLHTNLGRARLPDSAIQALHNAAASPVNLEYDLETGQRGDRDTHVEALICELTGAEAATVVNNNAAAVVLVLAALATGRDVLISRGELVEIGGSFRIPEVMGSAGCNLKEVGTTNRTTLADFESGVDGRTALMMRVHTSNYEIRGFTGAVPEADLAALAHQKGMPLVTDLGSGTLVDLSRYGLPHEQTAAESIHNGADVVTFSGDKLLGGPQAGIIVGRHEWVERIRRHPLKRALRVDKLTLAALSEVLRLYKDPDRLPQQLPTLSDLVRPLAEIRAVGERILPEIQQRLAGQAEVSLVACQSQVGSGALPVDQLDSMALSLAVDGDKALNELALRFRRLPRPVIGRIHDGRLLFDLRCLNEIEAFCGQLSKLRSGSAA